MKKMISRDEFSTKTIENQVAIVNTYMQQGKSILQIFRTEISMNESTFRYRAKKAGYILDKNTNKYVQKGTNVSEIHKNNTKVHTFDEGVAEIKEMLPMLKDMLEWYKKQKNVINIEPLQIMKFSGKVESKTFRVYEPVLAQFINFAEKNKQYKVQDLISQALAEFLTRYDFS